MATKKNCRAVRKDVENPCDCTNLCNETAADAWKKAEEAAKKREAENERRFNASRRRRKATRGGRPRGS